MIANKCSIKINVLITILVLIKVAASAQSQTYEEFGDSIQNWLEQRISNANKGIKEKVEMPFAVRTLGWGCMCPDNYIGISPNVQEGPWIAPKAPKNFPVSDTIGYSLIVTGYFTGKWKEKDFRNKDGEPQEWLYKMPEFNIISWRENKLGYETPPPKVIK